MKLSLVKLFTLLSLLTSSAQAFSAAKITYLHIDGTNLIFSTDESKKVASPACALAATNHQWALSLNTQAGLSSYNLLLMAAANNLSVEVSSAGDCNDVAGLERPKSVSLAN